MVFTFFNLALCLCGQTGAYFWFDQAVVWKLQEPPNNNYPVIIKSNIGVGLADTMIALPVFAMAAVGLMRREFYGVICSRMAFYHSLSWPMVYDMSCLVYLKGNVRHTPVSLTNVLVPGALQSGEVGIFAGRAFFFGVSRN